MKRWVAIEWIKALQSGKYKQARHQLKSKDGHCCLGVLCAISPYKNNYTKMKSSENGTSLPHEVMNWAKTTSNRGDYGNNLNTCLATLNDNGSSFEEIAEIIEKEWKNL